MTEERYFNEGQQRILTVLMALFGREVEGASPGELAKSLGIQPSLITRDIANLRIAGLAEEVPGMGRYRLTPRMPQRALAMLSAIDEAAKKVEQTRQRYTREP